MQELEYYTDLFAHLHTAQRFGRPAPHKAILLLSVIDLVEKGTINSPIIPLSDELVKVFQANRKYYLGALRLYNPDIGKPFFHLQHESFWRLRDRVESHSTMAAETISTLQNAEKKELPRGSYSMKALRQAFCWAEIDPNLYHLLQNQEARGRLRVVLISTYLQNQPISRDSLSKLSVVSALMYLLAS